jgi:hypothetical protein
MTGKRYGSVIALNVVGKCSSRDMKWRFICDCGQQFDASGYEFRSGRRSDCPVCAAKRRRNASVIHGMSTTAEFRIWTGMLTRCYNQNAKSYVYYGKRGIKVCDRWRLSFSDFYADMGHRPSCRHFIDRINKDDNYEPGNCRWATVSEQARNKRNFIRATSGCKSISELAKQVGITQSGMWSRIKRGKSNDILRPSKTIGSISYSGITDTYQGWSDRTGIKPSTIAKRIKKYGWSLERSLSEGAKF